MAEESVNVAQIILLQNVYKKFNPGELYVSLTRSETRS